MSVAGQHGAMFAGPDAIPQHWQVTDIATVLIQYGECIDIDTVLDVGYECSTHAQHQPSMKSGSDFAASHQRSSNVANVLVARPLAEDETTALFREPARARRAARAHVGRGNQNAAE